MSASGQINTGKFTRSFSSTASAQDFKLTADDGSIHYPRGIIFWSAGVYKLEYLFPRVGGSPGDFEQDDVDVTVGGIFIPCGTKGLRSGGAVGLKYTVVY